MPLDRGWKARQEAALKRNAQRDRMFELNRARATVIGSQVSAETIVPIATVVPETPAPAAPIVIDEDQFDPATDPAPAPAAKGRKKQ